MINNKNIPYYLITAGVFVLLKFLFTYASSDELIYLLKPTNFIIELISNSDSQYLTKKGYYNKELNILIDKSCSGFNFLMLCFIMLVFLIVEKVQSKTIKAIALPVLFLTSYLLTIFVNSSRITLSILFQNLESQYSFGEISWLHQLEGSFVYLFFLVIIYLTIDFIFKTTNLR